MDVVKHILSYDRRFVIKKGKIILIKKLDKIKYASAIEALLKKPIIKKTIHNFSSNYGYEIYSVALSGNLEIAYEFNTRKTVRQIKFYFVNINHLLNYLNDDSCTFKKKSFRIR